MRNSIQELVKKMQEAITTNSSGGFHSIRQNESFTPLESVNGYGCMNEVCNAANSMCDNILMCRRDPDGARWLENWRCKK